MNERQALSKAIQAGDTAAARRLLTAHPALARARNQDGVSLLLQAVYYGRQEIVRAMLESEPALDLWEAAALGKAERVGVLLERNPALANALSPDGFPPLGLAAFFGHPGTMRALLAYGADPNLAAQNAARVRPIHSAAAHRQPEVALEMVALLLASGADPNVAQQGGWTPLHQAADHGQVELVELLLEFGADGQARSEDGRLPADMAQEKGFAELAQRLAAFG